MRLEQPRNECGGIAGLRGGEIPPDCVRAGRTRRHDRPVADSNAAAERRGQAGVTLERVEHFLVRRDPRQRGIVHRVEAVVQKRRVAMGEDARRQPLVGDAGVAQQSRSPDRGRQRKRHLVAVGPLRAERFLKREVRGIARRPRSLSR